ncbi:hypothetical protein POM88_024457 [Heracleum sosnowskyi]|uniref:Uncharacterized protein n=1 Tax=Heracleum sosnowskyi TaxID=360622 RepID=A0AAD8I4I3_9APIA|nr:hypothetical protein POM88_024457 [Heracleum sosnowskyi]
MLIVKPQLGDCSIGFWLCAIRSNDISDEKKLGEGGFGSVYFGKMADGLQNFSGFCPKSTNDITGQDVTENVEAKVSHQPGLFFYYSFFSVAHCGFLTVPANNVEESCRISSQLLDAFSEGKATAYDNDNIGDNRDGDESTESDGDHDIECVMPHVSHGCPRIRDCGG